MDETQSIDEVEEQEGEEQGPADLLHPLLDEPCIVLAAIVVSLNPGQWAHTLRMVTHVMKLLGPRARHRDHFRPIVEERADKVVHVLALLVGYIGVWVSLKLCPHIVVDNIIVIGVALPLIILSMMH